MIPEETHNTAVEVAAEPARRSTMTRLVIALIAVHNVTLGPLSFSSGLLLTLGM